MRPTCGVAAARFARAEALAGEAASAELPSLSGAGQIGYTKQTYNYIYPAGLCAQGLESVRRGDAQFELGPRFLGPHARRGGGRASAGAGPPPPRPPIRG